mmetsp:Transcript_43616/g.69885  ORF Transcript_43616/g.69885 Transcript_43616/m.69885 type:complete len:188 (-) Transcript_43616:129-692(-)|eukprot:CAMPEP_0197020594 /NCGR_PEP_ID=MMETSP1384-20130603/1415_1 /TAXON_ID=29189 /ORGANISM="Ammonia sp." /LENGTH=187 /DNA_ID=CAMNT_0042448249 /DNA_START=67 /DNA_END=630 /DNA_ORIENTATION=-
MAAPVDPMAKANQQYNQDVGGYQSISKKKDVEPERLAEVSAYLGQILGEQYDSGVDLLKVDLKDGTVLCRYLNAIYPNTCKGFKPSKIAFVARSNIQIYIEGCKKLGVNKLNLFETRDLFDMQRPWTVLDNIYAVSAVSRKLNFQGPFIGVKLAEKNQRNFSKEQLAEANKKLIQQSFDAHKGTDNK